MKNEVIYELSACQWQLLAVCAGLEEVYGICFDKQEFSREKLAGELHRMVGQQILKVEGEVLVPDGIYREMLAIVAEVEQILVVRVPQEFQESGGVLYPGSRCLWVQPSRVRKDYLELRIFQWEEWLSYLWEQEYLPDYKMQMETTAQACPKDENSARLEGRKLLLVEAFSVKEKESKRKLSLWQCPDGEHILQENPEKKTRIPYTKSRFEGALRYCLCVNSYI